jgi:hypothetical protein
MRNPWWPAKVGVRLSPARNGRSIEPSTRLTWEPQADGGGWHANAFAYLIAGPLGVRGRNSDNRLIRERLGWAPSRPLREGLEVTYRWISQRLNALKAADRNVIALEVPEPALTR